MSCRVKGVDTMEKIWVLCPTDQAQYLYFITEVAPQLDDAGISFSVAKPTENIGQLILKQSGRDDHR